MATAQSSFSSAYTKAVPGMRANTELENVISRTVESAAGVAFGQPVYRGSDDHGCVVGGTFAATAAAVAGASNTGNGAMGAITVTAGAQRGVYQLVIIEPGANVGNFALYDPSGVFVLRGTVASAFSGGGLAFTLADGATDFVAGDSFAITVTYTANVVPLGIVVVDPSVPAASSTPDALVQYQTASIMTQGVVWVTAGDTVVDGGAVYWDPADGRYTSTTTHIPLPNMFFDTSGVDGDLVRVVIRGRIN